MGEVRLCGICHSAELFPVLDLGEQPLAERFDNEDRYPLRLVECANCGLAQLSTSENQNFVFSLTSNSAARRPCAFRMRNNLLRR